MSIPTAYVFYGEVGFLEDTLNEMLNLFPRIIKNSIINLSYDEFAYRVVKVNPCQIT